MEREDKKTIVVTIFHSLISKNILNTDALKILQNSKDYRIILLVPALKKDFFEQYYSDENTYIEGIDMQILERNQVEKFMHTVSRLLIDTHYLDYKRHELLDLDRSFGGWFRHLFRQSVVRLFADNSVSRHVFHLCDRILPRTEIFQQILEKYNPSCVFSTDLFEQMGNQLIREARKRGIGTVGMVRSWDNCLSKGLLRNTPDVIIVNNSVIKQELIIIHGVKDDIINIVGLPQFDSFLQKKPEERTHFFKKNNLDPQKKLVMFAPGGNVLSDTDGDICKILSDAKKSGRLPQDIQFFIRNHPQHPADLSGVEGESDFTIQTPGRVLDRKNQKETELTPDDQEFLRNILAHTDVLIWVATSLCLDALVYSVPQVVVNFDGFKLKDYYHSVKRYHDEDHMKKMFALKPFRVANTAEDLIAYIDMYLKDTSVDRKERAMAKEQQLFVTDGFAGERIAEILKRQST